jgi:Holliday junction resolvasome RuvABC endonuclease subunit
MNTLTILALDISSTAVGVCYNGELEVTWKLDGSDIAARCQNARHLLSWQLELKPNVDPVVFEEPVGKFIKAIISQACVQGAVLALLSERGLAWAKNAPMVAKKVLTGKGNADKAAIMDAARAATGLQQIDEHRADALGLWVAARALRIERVAA